MIFSIVVLPSVLCLIGHGVNYPAISNLIVWINTRFNLKIPNLQRSFQHLVLKMMMEREFGQGLRQP